MVDPSEYGEDVLNKSGKNTKEAASGGKTAAKVAKNLSTGNTTAAAKEILFNFKDLVKFICIGMGIIALLFVMIFDSLPKMFMKSFYDGEKESGSTDIVFDMTMEEVQSDYKEIKDETMERFNELIDEASDTAAKAAKKLSEDKEYWDKYRILGTQLGIVTVTPKLSELSQIQSSEDILHDIYMLITIYDEDKTNYNNEEPTKYLDDKLSSAAPGTITVDNIRQWSGEQFDQTTEPDDIEEFKEFMTEEAPEMLKLYLPTDYQPDASAELKPIQREDEATKVEFLSATYRIQLVMGQWWDDGGNLHEAQYAYYTDIKASYYWSMEFDGVEYMLREYGWLVTEGGTEHFTEEAAELMPIVTDKADNYQKVDESGSVTFLKDQSLTAFSGTTNALYESEYEARIKENEKVNRNASTPYDGYYKVTSEFGKSNRSFISSTTGELIQENYNHQGLDLGLPSGTAVLAPCDGEIVAVGSTTGGGNTIVMYAGTDGTSTYYYQFAHLSFSFVTVGQKVKQGQKIALSGNTGVNTSGSHLHLQLDKYTNGLSTPIDPRELINGLPPV